MSTKKMIQSGLLLDRNKLKQAASGFILEEFVANQKKLASLHKAVSKSSVFCENKSKKQ